MRKLSWLAAAPAAAGLLALPFAQGEPRQQEGEGAPRAQALAPMDEETEGGAAERLTHAETWMAQLGSARLAEREAAWRELLDAARRDPGLRRRLAEWAEDGREVDRAWNARRLLRELELSGGGLGGLRGSLRGPWGGSDPFADPFGGGGFFGRDPFGGGDLPRLFEDVQRQLDELLQRGGASPFGAGPFGAGPRGGTMQGQSFQLESGPDGVKVRVQEEVDGKVEEKTYEAESLEALLEAYPELRERVQLSPGLPGGALGRLEDLRERLGASPFGVDPFGGFGAPRGEVATDRLGIYMREPGSYSASVEGLEPGVGLLVERVVPNSIASELGLSPGDVVIELNGRKLTSGEDVREALAARAADEPVVVKVVDSFGQARSLTWEPPRPDEAHTGPRQLRRL